MPSVGPRIAAFVVLACAAASCSAAETARTSVVVGSAGGERGELLAHIYAGAIRTAGVDTRVDSSPRNRDEALAALDAGEVAIVPDLTGALLTTFDSVSGATDADDVFVDLNKSLPEGLSVGDYALAEDRTAFAVSAESDVASLSELVPDCASTVVGAVDDPDGADPVEISARLGLTYGCDVTEFLSYADAGAAVDALNAGDVGALMFSTASFGPLAADLTALEDDKSGMRAQNVVPLVRIGALDDTATATLSVVAGELTTSDLADMIGEVRDGGESGDVAARWLVEHSL